jgi:cytosine permease
MKDKKSSAFIGRLDKLNEFERQPISNDQLQSGRHFAGLFAGEHVAATEFVIGALFVSKGAHTFDIIVGLILGNLLAVLSWAFVCSPIAVKTRLTLYWYLRKIGGPVLTIIYNILNAIMYCILAGAMITVSASAVRIPFGIPVQTGWLPTDIRFVLVVLAVGALVVALAILGFKKLAQFAEVCSPWMFLMFIAGALTMLPALLASMPELGSLKSFSDFWKLAEARIWPGPQPGQTDILGFFHIVSFAWICNLAMHLGMSDMALFRYARKKSYGFYSAFGMYLGHYLAWICAGIMGAGAALMTKQLLTQMDSGLVATTALGISGAIAVVIAGWTTSNPTIYRAGLALQIATPNWPRWRVTFFAGALTTIVACSPFVFTKLLDFIGVYGLLLMPIGAIVTVEHWIFPRIGLTQYWISKAGKLLNGPALLTWFITLTGAVFVWQNGILHLFFLIIPTWLCSAILYIVFAVIAGAGKPLHEMPEEAPVEHTVIPAAVTEKPKTGGILINTTGLIALASLIFCLVLAIWVAISSPREYATRLDYFKDTIIVATLIYFVAGTIWLTLKEKRITSSIASNHPDH